MIGMPTYPSVRIFILTLYLDFKVFSRRVRRSRGAKYAFGGADILVRLRVRLQARAAAAAAGAALRNRRTPLDLTRELRPTGS
jgi:hypothetical protein